MLLERIKEIVEQYPKLFSQIISRDMELNEFIMENHISDEKSSYSEKIYSVLNNDNGLCSNNQKKRFVSFRDGYGYCGKTAACACAKVEISKKVSEQASSRTVDEQADINKKRARTVSEKYGGASTVLQTSLAKQAHSDFYADATLVKESLDKNRATKLARYGNATYNNPEQIKKTWSAVAEQYFSEEKYQILRDKDKLGELYSNNTVEEIAKILEVHVQTVYKWTARHGLRKIYRSSFEDEIVQFLEQNGVTNITRNTRRLIPEGKEIDIFLPDYNLAIEYNGVYWHNDRLEKIHRLYHYNKVLECRKKSIDLLTIFSHHWETKKDIIKKHLLYRLKKSQCKIFARNTIAKKISHSESKEFLNANHIQGSTIASFNYGLYDNDVLVAVMTFSESKSRKLNSKDVEVNTYELVRYATSQTVVGGASKLLNAFLKEHSPKTIVSYSDNMYSSGALYKTLGFNLESETVSYFYVDPSSLAHIHRYTLNKKKLVAKGADPLKTERQITDELGYLRVPDCGICKWVLTVEKE